MPHSLNLKVNLDLQNIMFASPRKKRKIEAILPDDTELHKLLILTLAAGKDEERKLLALYGPVTQTTTPMKVTVHGSCCNAGKISASAGAATYWGPNAHLNTSARISTCSEYVIHSKVHYAARNETCDLPKAQRPLDEPQDSSAVPEQRHHLLDVLEVTTELPSNSGPDEPSKKLARTKFPLPHRGRHKLAAMRDENRKKIMEAPSRAVF
ncbi:hypothetical protein DFH08DRAFT_820471 [Mycena albidolilacea]|uniref:Uncharacterized protein n=1 Tax=Mycena albidolilacea TaxID=1033008 RepID=A0AAD7EE62_9AGAR|nr:hypothetical protein DFH08DRAFT_820471 [Mycena albidolilacea]